jgi:hypothetical protein
MPNADGLKEFGRLRSAAAAKLVPAPPKLSDYPRIKKILPEVEKYDEDMKKFVQEGIGNTVNTQ